MPTPRSSPGPDLSDHGLFAHQPPPRADGLLPVIITHLELQRSDWTRVGRPPASAVSITHERAPSVAHYRELYDEVGRPWLWYERRLLNDPALALLLGGAHHELHVARDGAILVGFFELNGAEIAFFGLTLRYIGRGIGPWLLDRAIERGFAAGAERLELNTNTLDHPAALGIYRKAGFRITRRESRELQDPRVLWPDVYRWPPA